MDKQEIIAMLRDLGGIVRDDGVIKCLLAIDKYIDEIYEYSYSTDEEDEEE